VRWRSPTSAGSSTRLAGEAAGRGAYAVSAAAHLLLGRRAIYSEVFRLNLAALSVFHGLAAVIIEIIYELIYARA
jgi:hypothetical protein